MPGAFKLPTNAYEHAITWLQADGTELYSTQGNLFEKVRSMTKCYVVDSNADWFSAAAKYPDVAFVLGTTIDKEIPRLQSVFANSKGKKVRPNVFVFGVQFDIVDGVHVPLVVIRRLDDMFAEVMDLDALRKVDASSKGPPDLQTRKKEILRLLAVDRIQDLPPKSSCEDKDKALVKRIQAGTASCLQNFAKCDDLSKYAFARLLIDDQDARHTFSDDANPNVFGDAELIQNTLFFGAEALSEDRDVRFMAGACSIKCVRPKKL